MYLNHFYKIRSNYNKIFLLVYFRAIRGCDQSFLENQLAIEIIEVHSSPVQYNV